MHVGLGLYDVMSKLVLRMGEEFGVICIRKRRTSLLGLSGGWGMLVESGVRDRGGLGTKLVREVGVFTRSFVRGVVVLWKRCVRERGGLKKSCLPPPLEDNFWNSPK